MKTLLLSIIIAVSAIIQQASGHGGRLMDPPSRSSAWRVGFPTPHNYEDNDVSCGGFLTLVSNGGKCGVCGDPWNGKRDNEAGGKYATGTIVRKYNIGQTINITVDVTGDHLGWMEFRICPNNDVTKPVTYDCLNKHLLQKADGTGARTHINSRNIKRLSIAYILPNGMACSQCVLQWKYHTDDTWGVDKDTGRACIGCGYQEEFYGCADVAIGGKATVPQQTVTPMGPRVHTTKAPIQTTKRLTGVKIPCKGIHNWANDPDMDRWCTDNCAIGNCPIYGCECSGGPQSVSEKATTTTTTTLRPTTTTKTTTTTTTTPKPTTTSTTTTTPKPTTTSTITTTTPKQTTTSTSTTTPKPTTTSTSTTVKTTQPTGQMINVCKAINLWAGNEYLDRWCADSCSHGKCPPEACKCTMVQKGSAQSTTTPLPKTTGSMDQHKKVCRALSLWQGIQVFDLWCTDECNKGNCPDDTCQCTETTGQTNTPTTTTTTTTVTTSTTKPPVVTSLGNCSSNGIVGGDFWNGWCQKNCDEGICDTGYCFCNV